jgi:hypothetical protein
MDRATALGASDTNRLAYLLEVGNTTLLIGESGKEIFEQHIYWFCCKSTGFIAHSEKINIP